MLNNTLANALVTLKSELRISLTSGVGTGEDTRWLALIDEMQERLSDEYDWPFLEHNFDVSVAAGSRYVALPTLTISGTTFNLNILRPVQAQVVWNQYYYDLDPGIGIEEYNQFSSGDNGVVVAAVDPIQRWQLYESGYFEVWPIPATNQIIRFNGQRTLKDLGGPTYTDTSKVLDLDHIAIALHVAARQLAQDKDAKAPMVASDAKSRMDFLRSSLPTRYPTFGLGRGSKPDHDLVRSLPIVAVAGNK